MAAPWGDPEFPAISGRFLCYSHFLAVETLCIFQRTSLGGPIQASLGSLDTAMVVGNSGFSSFHTQLRDAKGRILSFRQALRSEASAR